MLDFIIGIIIYLFIGLLYERSIYTDKIRILVVGIWPLCLLFDLIELVKSFFSI